MKNILTLLCIDIQHMWHDLTEIIGISTLFYAANQYLGIYISKYLYAYILTLAIAHWFQLSTIIVFLTLASPVVCIILILLHQDQLQRNLIAYKRATTSSTSINLESLIQQTISAQHHRKSLIWIIEHTDSLENFLSTQSRLNAPLSETLLHFIISSITHHATTLWISRNGTLISHQATWNNQTSSFITESLAYSLQLDCFICIPHIETISYTVIVHGEQYACTTIDQVISLLKKHTNIAQNLLIQKGATRHVDSHKNKSTATHRS